jgi:small subunit ribosomal protein S5
MDNNRNRKFGRNKQASEFDQKLLDLARVARVVKGGRRFSFRATMVIGNRRGKVGLGTAKGSDVSIAITKAITKAKKALVEIKRKDSTISFEVREKFGAAKVLIKPAKEGRGIVAGGAMRMVIELAGIKNITAKSLGSSNKINVGKATIKALEQLEGKRADSAFDKKKNNNDKVSAKEEKKSIKKEVKKDVTKKAK